MDLAFKQIMYMSTKTIRINIHRQFFLEVPPNIVNNTIVKPSSDKKTQIESVNNMIRDNNYRYIICSDGSTLKVDQESCGKSGAAAVIYDNNLLNDPVMLKRDLGTQSNNYVAELVGINIGLKYLESCIETGSALFLVDCLPALNSSFSSKIGKTYTNEVAQNVLLTRQLLEKGWEIEATWMPGHEGFQANELADKLAKEVT